MLYQVIEDGEITQSYAMPDHDDTHHITTAKRNLAGGVAGLDASGFVSTTQLKNAPVDFGNTVSLKKRFTTLASGSDIFHCNDVEVSTISTSQAIGLEITIDFCPSSSIRISYDRKISNASYQCETEVAVNNSWKIAISGTSSTSYETVYGTLTGLVAGDRLQIRYASTNGAATAYIRNFRLLGTITQIHNSIP